MSDNALLFGQSCDEAEKVVVEERVANYLCLQSIIAMAKGQELAAECLVRSKTDVSKFYGEAVGTVLKGTGRSILPKINRGLVLYFPQEDGLRFLSLSTKLDATLGFGPLGTACKESDSPTMRALWQGSLFLEWAQQLQELKTDGDVLRSIRSSTRQ